MSWTAVVTGLDHSAALITSGDYDDHLLTSDLTPPTPPATQTTRLHNLFLIGEILITELDIIGVQQSPNLLSARIHFKLTENNFLKCKC